MSGTFITATKGENMSEDTQSQRPWFFNLKANGDNAIVRLLHTTPQTIEAVKSHRVEIDGKKKRIRCIGEGCPLCANGNVAEDRIYVHLFDYTDNKEKVWERTDKILPQLEELVKSWNPLNSAVVKITRVGDAFPKYTIDVQNPMNFAGVDNSLVDKEVAKMFSMKRSAEDITTFVTTGKLPERTAFIPKAEYAKMKAEERKAIQDSAQPTVEQSTENKVDEEPFDDPFAIAMPKRI